MSIVWQASCVALLVIHFVFGGSTLALFDVDLVACLILRRGIETNLELSPGEATTERGRNPLGGVLNEQAMYKVEELEAENSGLRSMLVDLQVGVCFGVTYVS